MAATGATASSTIVYEIEPGGRLGWHTDATEETQYIIAGTGKLHSKTAAPRRAGQRVRAADPMRHDLGNTGKETLRAVAFFAAAMFTQDFDSVMLPPKTHILGTPNREGCRAPLKACDRPRLPRSILQASAGFCDKACHFFNFV